MHTAECSAHHRHSIKPWANGTILLKCPPSGQSHEKQKPVWFQWSQEYIFQNRKDEQDHVLRNGPCKILNYI